MEGQFQTFALHLGDKLHDCHQDSGNQRNILQHINEDDIPLQHDFPYMGSPFHFYHPVDTEHTVACKTKCGEHGKQKIPPCLYPFFIKYSVHS